MKYAILSAADQTIVYQMENGDCTIKHPEAMLWTHPWDAEIECDKLNNQFALSCTEPLSEHALLIQETMKKDPRKYWRWLMNHCDGKWYIVEEVKDEVEFRSREDTW